MQLNKKILLIALTIAFHGAVMSMDSGEVFFNEIEENALCIMYFAQDCQNTDHMLVLGRWLNAEREKTSDTKKWNGLINAVINHKVNDHKNKEIDTIKNVVLEVASKLQSGQDCSQLLIDRTQEAIAKLK